MLTDRVPSRASGYGIRIANVIDGLIDAGDLLVCCVDSSHRGADLPHDDRYDSSIIRAGELRPWRRAVQALWTIPNLTYADEQDLRDRVLAVVGHEKWDLVWFSRIRVHRLCADLVPGEHILDLDDLNDRLRISLAVDQWQRRRLLGLIDIILNLIIARRWKRRYERLLIGDDQLVVTHHGDRSHLGQPECAVVPNGYPPIPHPPSRQGGNNSLIFVGPLTYQPNYLAVCWFVEQVLDRIRAEVHDASLAVIGDVTGTSRLPHHEAVRYHGFVDDLDPFYERAAVAVTPLRSGGGTRIKVLEAMARRRPVVATSFAVEGLGLVDGYDCTIADDAESFAARCIELLTDGAERRRLAEQAHATFSEGHTSAHTSAAVRTLATATIRSANRRRGPGR